MIQVTDKYYIKVTDCYIVQEKTVIKKEGKNQGADNYINATYHGSMHEALSNIIHRIQKDKLNTDSVISLQQAIKELVSVQREFIDAVKSVEEIRNEK